MVVVVTKGFLRASLLLRLLVTAAQRMMLTGTLGFPTLRPDPTSSNPSGKFLIIFSYIFVRLGNRIDKQGFLTVPVPLQLQGAVFSSTVMLPLEQHKPMDRGMLRCHLKRTIVELKFWFVGLTSISERVSQCQLI